MELMEKLFFIICLVALDYVSVLIAVLADMRSGILKAKRTGETRTSRGYRRTVEKASRYYITLIAMTVIDSMTVSSLIFLSMTGNTTIPPMPLFTTIGAIGLCLIELKSIYENSQVKGDYDSVLKWLQKAFKDPKIRELINLEISKEESEP